MDENPQQLSPQQPTPIPTTTQPIQSPPSQQLTYNQKPWKKWVVILLLLFAYPIGIILMWLWMKQWLKWIKILITLPFILGIIGPILAILAIRFISPPKITPVKMPTVYISPSPTPDPTADWKTYISNKGKFIIKYPETWLFITVNDDDITFPGYSKVYTSILYNPNSQITTTSEDLLSNNSLILGSITTVSPEIQGQKWKNISESEFYNLTSKFRHLGEFGGGATRIYEKPSEIKAGEIRFIKQINRPSRDVSEDKPGVIDYEYTTLSEGNVLTIRFQLNTQNSNAHTLENTFDQILSTFKFTDQTTVDTSSWKTHTTSKFSFQYPPNLIIKETDKDYFVFVENTTTPANNSNMSIDARLSGNYANYDTAVTSTKDGLINIKEETISTWLKIKGTIKPGFREGTPLSIALYKYNQGAIEFEIAGNTPVSEEIFNQILSTFKFIQ